MGGAWKEKIARYALAIGSGGRSEQEVWAQFEKLLSDGCSGQDHMQIPRKIKERKSGDEGYK